MGCGNTRSGTLCGTPQGCCEHPACEEAAASLCVMVWMHMRGSRLGCWLQMTRLLNRLRTPLGAIAAVRHQVKGRTCHNTCCDSPGLTHIRGHHLYRFLHSEPTHHHATPRHKPWVPSFTITLRQAPWHCDVPDAARHTRLICPVLLLPCGQHNIAETDQIAASIRPDPHRNALPLLRLGWALCVAKWEPGPDIRDCHVVNNGGG